jgi:hypothetical protein
MPDKFTVESIHLPVQQHGRHMLLAVHVQHLYRTADLFISAYEGTSENPALQAAKERYHQARDNHYHTSGAGPVSFHDHTFYRLRVDNDLQAPGDESSFFLTLRGYVLHFALFSVDHTLAAMIESAIEHIQFNEPGDSACTIPTQPTPTVAAMAAQASDNAFPAQPDKPSAAPTADPPPEHLYYGPALPTDLVESTLRDTPGSSVPSGHFSRGTFVEPALGLRVVLPSGWSEMPNSEAYRVTDLMRDPTTDTEVADRRRSLFRACSRVIFTATDPETELISQVHPSLAVVAMPQGCIPDLILPAALGDKAADEEFATVLVRSLGVLLLGRGSVRTAPDGHLTVNLDGTLPYQLPGEMLSRRLGLRVTASASGPWLVFVYAVAPNPAALHELESHVTISSRALPDSTPASELTRR